MTTELSQSYRHLIILVIVIGLFTGCGSVFQDLDNRMHRKQYKSGYASLDNALSVYNDGDYVKALGLFKALSKSSTNEKLARKAWMGEACCLLMIADTEQDYIAAMGLWRDVRNSAPENVDAWDLDLLDPLIVRMSPKTTTRVIEIHTPPARISKEIRVPAEPPKDDRLRDDQQQVDLQFQSELATLKEKAANADQLKRALDAVMTENRSLKEKIKAMEAIDQNIQKKKTKIEAPTE